MSIKPPSIAGARMSSAVPAGGSAAAGAAPPPPAAAAAGGGPAAATGAINIIGDIVQHVSAGQEAVCELSAVGYTRESIDINILSPSKVPVSYR